MKEKLVYIIIHKWIEEDPILDSTVMSCVLKNIVKIAIVFILTIKLNKFIIQYAIKPNSAKVIQINRINVNINNSVVLPILKLK